MSLDFTQLREYVVRPVLEHLDPEIPYSIDAENLVIGTMAQESHGAYLKQLGGGPAVGIIQMEPATHDDIYTNFLRYQPELKAKIETLELSCWQGWNDARELAGNLYYATAMCRVHYFRSPRAIPASLAGQAALWKDEYNTHLGAGTPAEYIANYHRFVGA